MNVLCYPLEWYWLIGVDACTIYSRARATSVSATDAAYLAWLKQGNIPTRFTNSDELINFLRANNIAPYHLVPTRLIVDRLQAAGKLADARAALDSADLYLRERWNSRLAIYADDADAAVLLAAIGADPAQILAPE